MLDTLLDIGRILRNANKVKYHGFIQSAPVRTDKNPISYISLPVTENFEFDFNNWTYFEDETVINKDFYYLAYKTSKADNQNRYIYGDIYYSVVRSGKDKGKENGFYRIGSSNMPKSSFFRAKENVKGLEESKIGLFRKSFEKNIEKIHDILRQDENRRVFLHFDFDGEFKHWYEMEEEFELLQTNLLNEFFVKDENIWTIKKAIYKTLASGDEDPQFPNFTRQNRYKSRAFNNREEVLNLVYAFDYSEKALITENKIKIIVLPKCNNNENGNLTAEQIESFFSRVKSVDADEIQEKETLLNINSKPDDDEENDPFEESLFKPFVAEVADNITQYDFIFSKKGSSLSAPDVDMLELAGIKKSFLQQLNQRIGQIKDSDVLQERERDFPKRPKQFSNFDIRKSFLNILGDVTKDKKKYQSHLFKVLPEIYSGSYYQDAVLLPAFIEKVEYNTRNLKATEFPDYNLLKYDYYFLVLIRNRIIGVKEMNEINKMKNDDNYKIGLLLGHLAQRVSQDINSFEKGYVGLLSRHIADFDGLVYLSNFIRGKLAIHNRLYYKVKKRAGEIENIMSEITSDEVPNFAQVALKLDSMITEANPRNFNRHYCIFGFFEGYFAKYLKLKD